VNIISVDLPWKSDKRGRRALAIADLDGNVKIMSARDDNELLTFVQDSAEPKSLILLDIPIDGCENLGSGHFRPIDKALGHQGIWIQPASGAGNRGKKLEEILTKSMAKKGCRVYEIYPYAIYKFLAYLQKLSQLHLLNSASCEVLLGVSFRKYVPPKYKRERKKNERLENMKYLYSLLTDKSIGLNFRIPLHYPDSSSDLNQLSDEYDACLGAIVGIYFANDSSYACIAGDSESGEILLLADEWLQTQLRKGVEVKNLK